MKPLEIIKIEKILWFELEEVENVQIITKINKLQIS